FYPDSSFEVYHTMGVLNPSNLVALCDALYEETGVPVVVMDANDFDQNQLGKATNFPLTDEQIQDAMKDNPSGQGDELTPFILIRPLN
ncbi:MAG: F420-0--gamma-glutamyl ligase, partial [Clostridia bacterium]|nr:F420-0--gamma-glutamyl ligase [Clostridia bacterium]